MNIGDLVTWKLDVYSDIATLEYGVVIGVARKVDKTIDLLWVKFTNGQHSHRAKTLCNIDHLILVDEVRKRLDKK